MRIYIVLMAIMLVSAGCATSGPSASQIEMRDKVLAEYEEWTQAQQKNSEPKTSEPENPWLAVVEPIMGAPSEPRAGMSMNEFFKGRGAPDRSGIIDGKEVLWYDGNEPYFVEFKNKKLVSYYIDRETIQIRAENQRRQQEAYERAQYEDQARDEYRKREAIRAIGNAFKPQPMPYQIQNNSPVRTNCYPGIGGSVQCTSY